MTNLYKVSKVELKKYAYADNIHEYIINIYIHISHNKKILVGLVCAAFLLHLKFAASGGNVCGIARHQLAQVPTK